MKQVIISKRLIALQRYIQNDPVSSEVIPFEAFGTPYGMFFPVAGSVYQLVRWIQKGMTDILPTNAVSGSFVHISNSGEMLLGNAQTADNTICLIPYTSEKFSLVATDREVSEAFSSVLKKCTTIAQAVNLIESRNVDGMHNPIILMVDEWVAYAKEKGYDKTFYRTTFFD